MAVKTLVEAENTVLMAFAIPPENVAAAADIAREKARLTVAEKVGCAAVRPCEVRRLDEPENVAVAAVITLATCLEMAAAKIAAEAEKDRLKIEPLARAPANAELADVSIRAVLLRSAPARAVVAADNGLVSFLATAPEKVAFAAVSRGFPTVILGVKV